VSEDLENLIKKIESQSKKDEMGALAAASELIKEYSEDVRVWSLRSYIYEAMDRYEDAVNDVSKAILIKPLEPGLYFSRGRYLINLERYKESIDDFSPGIELCDLHNNDYYRETLHFFRAFSYLRMGDKKGVLNDLSHIQDEDFSLWIDGMVSKKEMLDAAHS
jgi:tetratricopeptide (TPR) repeat protein